MIPGNQGVEKTAKFGHFYPFFGGFPSLGTGLLLITFSGRGILWHDF
jgi:hypothetical protein